MKIFSCTFYANCQLYWRTPTKANFIAGQVRCISVRVCVCCFTLVTTQISGTPTDNALAELQLQQLLWLHLKIFYTAVVIWIQLDVAAPKYIHILTPMHAYMHHHCGCFNNAFSCRRTTKITRCKAQSTGPLGDYNNGRCSCPPLWYTGSKKYAGTVSSDQWKMYEKLNEGRQNVYILCKVKNLCKLYEKE